MKSKTTSNFWKMFDELPSATRKQAVKNYRLWLNDTAHVSLKFKQIHASRSYYSVRVGINWRAVGVKVDDEIVWFWIGSHADYDNLLKQLR